MGTGSPVARRCCFPVAHGHTVRDDHGTLLQPRCVAYALPFSVKLLREDQWQALAPMRCRYTFAPALPAFQCLLPLRLPRVSSSVQTSRTTTAAGGARCSASATHAFLLRPDPRILALKSGTDTGPAVSLFPRRHRSTAVSTANNPTFALRPCFSLAPRLSQATSVLPVKSRKGFR